MKKSLTITMTGTAFLLSILFTLTYHSEADLIDETCKKTQYPDLCLSTLRANPSSAGADVKGLARIMLEAALSDAKATLVKVKNLLEQTSDPVLKECFTICNSQYESALEDINNAIQKVGSDNFSAGVAADAAIDDARTCEEAFTTDGPIKRPSPLTDMNTAVRQIVATAEGIINALG